MTDWGIRSTARINDAPLWGVAAVPDAGARTLAALYRAADTGQEVKV